MYEDGYRKDAQMLNWLRVSGMTLPHHGDSGA